MEKTRLLIIDDNELLIGMIEEHFKDVPNIKVSLEARDGEEGILLIDKNQNDYDLILLDIVMPKKDGIDVLEYMNEHNINKKVIVVTSYNTPDMIRKVASLGANYMILKPFELSDLEVKINRLKEKEYKKGEMINILHNKIQVSIINTLHELGVPSHMKGYQYIREGIYLIYESNEASTSFIKKIYPLIAKKYHSTISKVERSIRHAIEISWNRGNWDLMEELFGNSIDDEKAKPTNSEFIITIAEKLKLEFFKEL